MKILMFFISLLTLNIKSADFEILLTGTDKLTSLVTISDNHLFMTLENTFQLFPKTRIYSICLS